MNDWSPFWWVACGVIVAVIFPVLSGFVRQEFKATAAVGLPPWMKNFWGVLLFSLITALICLAGWRSSH